MANYLLFLAIILSTSCSEFLAKKSISKQIKDNEQRLQIYFSHNINGETHPCGCRHFPLGGLPQIAGAMAKGQKMGPKLYLDTGDALFDSTKFPERMRKSSEYNAENLSLAMEKLGLEFFLPGDQDFAAGENFLVKLSKKRKFKFLISNLSSKSKIKHIKWAKKQFYRKEYYFLGIANPALYSINNSSSYFTEPLEALKESIDLITEKGFDKNNPDHKLILLSHSGFDFDSQIAKNFEEIDYIIGAHSVSFLREPIIEGNAKIVQTLSRNHYLGKISFPLFGQKNEQYELVEVRDGLRRELSPNPFEKFINNHKEKMNKIFKEEQSVGDVEPVERKLNTYISCKSCHNKQYEFWQKTGHALAYATLIKENHQHDPKCIGCHTLGYNKPKGFSSTQALIDLENNSHRKKTLDKFLKSINHDVIKKLPKSVRKLSSKQRQTFSSKWTALVEKHQIIQDYSHVQCLNCHQKHIEHPYEEDEWQWGPKIKLEKFREKCISCHNSEQSPEWYKKDKKGLPGKLNTKIVDQQIKKLSCPVE